MPETIVPRTIETDMKESYLDYAMSVIIGRAIPDARDGLKPVHRRILYSMHELGNVHGKPTKKSARIVGECFVKGTKVLTTRGLVPIEEIEVGDKVITQTGENSVTELYEMPEKELIKIKLETGISNIVTPSQKFKVFTEDFQYEWKEAKDLREGDYVVIKATYPEVIEQIKLEDFEGRPIYLDENIAYMVGQLLSDGWVEQGYNHGKEERCAFSSSTEEVMERVADIIEDKFDYDATVETWEHECLSANGSVHLNTNTKFHKFCVHWNFANSNTMKSVRINKTAINRFLISVFDLHGAQAHTKKIPVQFFYSPRQTILGLISGLIEGDGSIHVDRNVINYSSVSETLVDQLQLLLLHLGIFSRKYIVNAKQSGRINGREIQSRHVSYSLEISGIFAVRLGRMLNLVKAEKARRALFADAEPDPSVFEEIPYAGRYLFGELGAKHLGGGWYQDTNGKKFRGGIKYPNGSKIRYSSDLRKKMLTRSQILEWGILTKLQAIQSPLYKIVQDIINNDIYFIRVSKIEKALTDKTYDVQIEESHEFVANGMVSHNCLGKYHPHGDMAVYDAMVRMAQTFSLRYMLVDGQGNLGSIDGDNPAAMRYTEVRMAKITAELLQDLDKETVPYGDNFDGTLKEPLVLPAKIPNLLINGSSGIAVGMATNIPPHNLTEIIDGTVALIDGAGEEELLKRVTGPDFPTGGIIVGRGGILQAYKTGRGSLTVRGKAEKDEKRHAIIISEIPYQMTKTSLIESMVEAVKNKKIEGISGVHDRSDKQGMEVMVEVKKSYDLDIVLNQLYAHTQLQTSFGIINLAIVGKEPKVLTLKSMIEVFIEFRKEIVRKRCEFELKEAKARAHVLEGLRIALEHIDPIVEFLRKSKDLEAARKGLMEKYKLSEIQANAILDMKLSRLIALEREKIETEYQELIKQITWLNEVLADVKKILEIIKKELLEIKEKYGDKRRTDIIDGDGEDLNIESLIPNDDVVVVISNRGYVKRVGLDEYRSQHRGGKGVIGTETKEEDVVQDIIVTKNHNYLLLFTNKGRVFWLKVYRVPEGGRYATGRTLVSLLELKDERVTSWISVDRFDSGEYLSMATKNGIIKRTALENFSNVRRTGVIAITLKEGDGLVEVIKTDGKQDVLIATKKGQAIRFKEDEARELARTGQGVIGIRFKEGEDEVIGITACRKPAILTITENGYGKRTSVDEYRTQGRGGSGVINIKTEGRNGDVVAIRAVNDDDEIIVMSSKGQAIRSPVSGISVVGRNTQGVRIIRLAEGEKVATFAAVPKSEAMNEQTDATSTENKEKHKK